MFEETGIEIGTLQLISVFSGKNFCKITKRDEFYPITIAYLCKDIKGGLLKADGIESLSVQFLILISYQRILAHL